MRKFLLASAMLALCSSTALAQKPELGTFGVDTQWMDSSVKPGDDFFRFVSGAWLKTDRIPADRARFGSFDALGEQSEIRSRAILEEAAKANAKPGTPLRQVGDFYASFMDEARIESLGLKPLAADLKRIRDIKSFRDYNRYQIYADSNGLFTPINAGVTLDQKDSNQYIVAISQGGLGLPDRDFYLNEDERFKTIRARYIKHIETLFTLAGEKDAAARAQAIFDFEKKLAEVHWTRAQNRDRDKTYNLKTLAELQSLAPAMDWAGFMKGTRMNVRDAYVVVQPSAVAAMSKIIAETPIAVLRDQLTFNLIARAAPFLPKAFADERFEFTGRTLQGTKEQAPRWRRGVNTVNGSIGEAVGQVWVERHFTPEAKARMDVLVRNVTEAFGRRIDGLDWMSPETKKEARAKLATFVTKIGYPKKWRDYSKLDIRADDLLGNLRRVAVFEANRDRARLGKPTDRDEWFMPPQTVNAYYNPIFNEIVFPAAILQPPFFDPYADDAVNYGAIGGVIGHEIGHGFDDQGRKSDGKGTLRDWWTAEDDKRFRERSDRLVAQYNAFCPLPPTGCINGRLALGENIGDLGGLQVAYEAYRMSLGGKEAPVIDGFTGDQRFFMAWAQVWRAQQREASLRQQLTVGPHSPAEFRANGVVRNLDAWYKAFNVQPGDKLYLPPEERVRIW
jgi:putative endopeptidase